MIFNNFKIKCDGEIKDGKTNGLVSALDDALINEITLWYDSSQFPYPTHYLQPNNKLTNAELGPEWHFVYMLHPKNLFGGMILQHVDSELLYCIEEVSINSISIPIGSTRYDRLLFKQKAENGKIEANYNWYKYVCGEMCTSERSIRFKLTEVMDFRHMQHSVLFTSFSGLLKRFKIYKMYDGEPIYKPKIFLASF